MNDLLEQMKNKNEEAFSEFYTKTYKYVYSRAKCMFSDEGQVQDLVQEVYLALYRNLGSIQSNENIYGWLKTTTFYQGTKMLQKKRKEVLLSEEGEGVFESIPDEQQEIEEDYMNKEDVEVIRQCIDRLSDEQRTVLLAYYYDNLKVNEIAEIFSISDGTVKSRLYLARKNLKLHVEGEEKKRGYKLHSFGAVTLALALRAFLQSNMETASAAEETVFAKLCQTLQFHTGKTVGKGIVAKVLDIGVKKIVVSVTGIVATTAVVAGVTFGTDLIKPKESDLMPEMIESEEVQEQEEKEETGTDEEEKKEEDIKPSKPGSSSGAEEPKEEQEGENGTSDTQNGDTQPGEETQTPSAPGPDNPENKNDDSDKLQTDADKGENSTWGNIF